MSRHRTLSHPVLLAPPPAPRARLVMVDGDVLVSEVPVVGVELDHREALLPVLLTMQRAAIQIGRPLRGGDGPVGAGQTNRGRCHHLTWPVMVVTGAGRVLAPVNVTEDHACLLAVQ